MLQGAGAAEGKRSVGAAGDEVGFRLKAKQGKIALRFLFVSLKRAQVLNGEQLGFDLESDAVSLVFLL